MKISEWTYGCYGPRTDFDILVDGFTCNHCDTENKFNGEDADYLDAGGKKGFCNETIVCEHCGIVNLMPPSE